MKQKLSIVAVLMMALAIPQSVKAYDFSYTYQGSTLYYTIKNGSVSVGTSGGNPSGDVIIPDSVIYNDTWYVVTGIDDWAFGYCYNMTSISIPNTITNIGNGAFWDCDGLTSIVIPVSVTQIGSTAFYGCDQLTSLYIPSSVVQIGERAFTQCSSLSTIIVDNNNSNYDSRNNCNALIETATNTLLVGCQSTVIPSSVTTIGRESFRGCLVTTMNIPNTVTIIDQAAFAGCSNLVSVTIPNSVTKIRTSAFFQCTSLSSVFIPASVDSIGINPFCGCSSITSLCVDANNTHYDSRNNCNAIIQTENNKLVVGCVSSIIPNTVTSIGTEAFRLSIFSNITLPNSITIIENNAFAECDNLIAVSFPNTVSKIGHSAFLGCYNLESLVLPSSVTEIGDYAFFNCQSIETITSLSTNPPMLGNSAFQNVPNDIPVYISCGLSTIYDTASGWDYFTNIQEKNNNFSATSINPEMGNVQIITPPTCSNSTAVIQAFANEGYAFAIWSDGNVENPRTITFSGNYTVEAFFSPIYYDTIYIHVHDTTYVDVFVHDTIYIDVPYPVHDTTVIVDTLWLTEYDTIYIHDTIVVGVDEVDAISAKVYTRQGQIVAEGAEGNQVWLYDVNGRVLATKQDDYSSICFDVPASGTYMIKIGNHPARKVVVVK